MDTFMSGNSPVHIFMDSLDNSIISRDKNDYFHLAKLKAGINAYNFLSANGSLNDKVLFSKMFLLCINFAKMVCLACDYSFSFPILVYTFINH